MREVTIGRDDAGQRLDRFLRKLLPSATLGHVFKLVRKGEIRVNGARARPELRLSEGDVVALRVEPARMEELARRPGAARSATRRRSAEAVRVLHRDEHVLAVDKPPMLLVQKGEGRGDATLEELVLEMLPESRALTFRPALAHRLDRGTSGIVLFGLTAEGLRGLTEAFRARLVTKRYLALVAGTPVEDEFLIDLPLARDPGDERRGKKVKVSRAAESKSAVTEVRVLARSPERGCALLECSPRTGRTHQIRAHLRAVRLPILGDPTYGDPRRNAELRRRPGLWRQFLHAFRVELVHPVTGAPLAVESPLPEDLVRALRWAGLGDASLRPGV